jgi:DNA-binding CsgD family transcriptional regulator
MRNDHGPQADRNACVGQSEESDGADEGSGLRRAGQRTPRAECDKKAKRVLGMHADGLSYRLIARNVGLSKNTVMDIVRRNFG